MKTNDAVKTLCVRVRVWGLTLAKLMTIKKGMAVYGLFSFLTHFLMIISVKEIQRENVYASIQQYAKVDFICCKQVK